MSERKLASIRRISAIRPIEGADNIVCAVVDGWELVTQKSNGFKEGDLVVYFEIDSVLPEREEFEFLRDRCYVSEKNSVNGAGFRLKTIKLRGQVSQGLILPLSSLYGALLGTNDYYEGMDLTEHLGVVKYEKPLPASLGGTAKGNFPSFIPKTDEERIQNCYKHLVNKWGSHRWEVSMKLDGSSFTAYYRRSPNLLHGEFGVCSRNLDLQETEGNAFWQVARKYDLESKMSKWGQSLAIQGELMGPGIQGNKENLNELKMFVFKIWDIDHQRYLNPEERYDMVEHFGLESVPIVEDLIKLQHENGEMWSVQEILEFADGPSLNAKQREGLVFKSYHDPSVSFKAISNKWLLKGGDD